MGASYDAELEMETAGVLHEMVRLRNGGEALDTAWSAARADVESHDRGIAGDLLGSTFRDVYAPDHDRVLKQADSVPPAIAATAVVGETCAHFYLVADEKARHHMPSPVPR
jgi:hypothetical protein